MNTVRVFIVLATVCYGILSVSGCSSSVDPKEAAQSMLPENAVFYAASEGNVAMLQSLLAKDPTLKDAYGPNGIAPLHAAADAGQNAAVQYLLEQGADPLVEDEYGNKPVQAAFAKAHKDTAKILQSAMSAKDGGAAQ